MAATGEDEYECDRHDEGPSHRPDYAAVRLVRPFLASEHGPSRAQRDQKFRRRAATVES